VIWLNQRHDSDEWNQNFEYRGSEKKKEFGQAMSWKVLSNNSVLRLCLKASTEKFSLTESLMIAGREFPSLGAYTSKERP